MTNNLQIMDKSVISLLLSTKNYPQLEDAGKLALRVLFGCALALNHGWPTFSTALAGGGSGFPDPLGLGPELSMMLTGTAEFVCVLFIIAGFMTRLFTIPVLINFATAFFIFHSGDSFGEKELAFIYLSAATCIMLLGPGKYSADYALFGD